MEVKKQKQIEIKQKNLENAAKAKSKEAALQEGSMAQYEQKQEMIE